MLTAHTVWQNGLRGVYEDGRICYDYGVHRLVIGPDGSWGRLEHTRRGSHGVLETTHEDVLDAHRFLDPFTPPPPERMADSDSYHALASGVRLLYGHLRGIERRRGA